MCASRHPHSPLSLLVHKLRIDARLAFIILSSMTLGAVNAFPDWHEQQDACTGEELDVRPFPSRGLRLVAVLAAGGAALIMSAAAAWQLAASVATARVVKRAVLDGIGANVGVTATVPAWLSAAAAGAVFYWLWHVNRVHGVCNLIFKRGEDLGECREQVVEEHGERCRDEVGDERFAGAEVV